MKLNQETIKKMAKEGERLNGRDLDEYREIELETGYIPTTSQGSAKVSIGDTQVVVGISVDVESPYSDRPASGTIVTNAELAPMASREFESGPPQEDGVELARVVDRGIRESEAVDLEELCIEEGEEVYTVFIDVHVLNHDGNLIDASALAAVAALQEGYLPPYNEEDGTIDRDDESQDIPLTKEPITATGRKIEDALLWDTNGEEEEALDARMTVTLTEDDNIVAMQKGGMQPYSQEEIKNTMDEAKNQTEKLREVLEDERE